MPPVPGPRIRVAHAIVLGVVIAAVMGRSLFGRMGTAIPSGTHCSALSCADNALMLWVHVEAGRRLLQSPLTIFDAPIFHPLRHALAYSESALSGAVIVGPLDWLTGNPVLAFNLHYLGSIVLSVVGMFLLVRRMTGDPRAGLVAGGMFGLATERGFFWGFTPALALQWAPVLLVAWLAFVERPSWPRGAALALALLAHMHAGAYHGLMLPALLVPWGLILMAFGGWPLRSWFLSFAALACGGVAAAALYYPYVLVREELHYETHSTAMALSIQYVDGLLHPIAYVSWRIANPPGPFPLVSPLAWWVVAAAAIAVAARRRPAVPAPPRLGAHLSAAIVLTVLAMGVSLGPRIDTPFGIVPGPLVLLRKLPGYDVMRGVIRFMMLAAFARCIVAGVAMAILLRRLPRRAAGVACAVVLAIAALDARLDVVAPDVFDVTAPREWTKGYEWLATAPKKGALVELPYGLINEDVRYMLNGLSHDRPIMNGYSGLTPRFGDVIGRLPDEVAWQALRDAGVSYVLVHPSRFVMRLAAAQVEPLLRRHDLQVAAFDDTIVFRVPDGPSSALPTMTPLPRDGWRVEASEPGAERAIDGDRSTHWSLSSARDAQWIRVDLGREIALGGAAVALGAHFLEYPRAYEVWASRDGRQWDRIGGERPTLPPFASYRRDHRDVILPLRIIPAQARWVELRVAAYPEGAWQYSDGRWAIHELLLYEDASSRPTS